MSEPLVTYWVGKPHLFTRPSPGNEDAYCPVYLAAHTEALLNMIRQEVAKIAKPALGGKQQQWMAQDLLKRLPKETP